MTRDAYSAPADQGEILRRLRGLRRPPAMTYLVHGEPEAPAALRGAIVAELAWQVTVARDGERVALSA